MCLASNNYQTVQMLQLVPCPREQLKFIRQGSLKVRQRKHPHITLFRVSDMRVIV